MNVIPHSKPWLIEQDRQAILEVFDTAQIATGHICTQFENAVGDFVNSPFSKSVSSGSKAIELALLAIGIKQNDEVILPSYLCPSVLNAVKNVGGKAVLCDISSNWRMDKINVERCISEKTAAVIVVHTFGLGSDIFAIKSLGFPIVEDACQAFGLEVNNRFAGTIGDIGVYSFHATKCLTTGEGGMVVTANEKYTKKLERLTNGKRISDICAALGLSQIDRYRHFIEKRKKIGSIYQRAFANLRKAKIINDSTFSFRYPLYLLVDNFDSVAEQFLDHGICVRRGVDTLLHRLEGLEDRDFPVSSNMYAHTISIPYYPALSELEVDKIVKATKDILG